MDIKTLNLQALEAAEKQLNEVLNGGFRGEGVIPAHYALTRANTESALSLVRLAIQNARLSDG